MSHCCESLRLESNYLGYTRDSVGYKGRAMDKQAIGDRIKMLRERKGWTQGDLAEAHRVAPPSATLK